MVDDGKPKNVLQCSGVCCSLPLVEASMELNKQEVEQTLEVIADCTSAEDGMNILKCLKSYEVVHTWK
jgi:TusA-related sulfurtransferase